MYKVSINLNLIDEFDNFAEAIVRIIEEGKKITEEQELRNFISTAVIEWEDEIPFYIIHSIKIGAAVYSSGMMSNTRTFEFEQIINIANVLGITDDNGDITGDIPEIKDEEVEKDIFGPTMYMDRNEWNEYLKRFFNKDPRIRVEKFDV